MKIFPLHATDFYKTGHYAQYPFKTEKVYSNFTCRSSKLFQHWDGVEGEARPFDNKVVFFGLQYFCQNMLIDTWEANFFNEPKERIVARYKRRMDTALGRDKVSTEHIEKLYDLGYLPLLIKALPEGARVDIRVPLFTIQNTHQDFGWLTNYIETQLSAEIWKMITSATTAYEYRRMFDYYADKTGAPKAFVPWQGHDFSFRGMSGIEDAATSGAAHLLSFTGTDTIIALDLLEDYYFGADTFLGGSVPATEHSVMCMGGEETEIETYRRLINKVYPDGIVSIVSDTWDFWKVLTEFTHELREDILSRNGKVVFRPDSGDPVKIIVGDLSAERGSPAIKGAVECLWDEFGGTINAKGFKELDPHVGLIYGDSISLIRAEQILEGLRKKGFASSNIVFGIGSYTYNYVTRDSLGTAIKATWGQVNGKKTALFKQPKTDTGMKNSARGLLRVEREHGNYVLYENQTEEQEQQGLYKPVFKNGEMHRYTNVTEIRKRLLEG